MIVFFMEVGYFKSYILILKFIRKLKGRTKTRTILVSIQLSDHVMNIHCQFANPYHNTFDNGDQFVHVYTRSDI